MKNWVYFVVILWSWGYSQNKENIKEWKVYKNANYELQYLNHWQVELDKPFEDFIAYLRPSGQGLPMRETIVMTTTSITDQPIHNLDSYQRIKEEEVKNQIFRSEILESRITKKAGVPIHIIVYKGEMEGIRLKWKEWTWYKDKILYQLIFTAQESTYDTYIRSAEALQASIKFK